MDAYLILVVTSLLVGAACAWYARLKGRDPLRWFLVGAVLNIVAVGALAARNMRRNGDAQRRQS